MEDLVKNDANRPDIDGIGVCLEPSLFGGNIFFGSSHRLHNDVLGAQSEVGNFEIWEQLSLLVLSTEQDVLWF